MSEKIIVGPINKGLRNDRTAFIIDNDSFPKLINAYQWRGRIKRKRGTSLLNRLQRFFNSLSTSYNSGPIFITLDGLGNGNILTGFSLQVNGNLVPGTVVITASGGPTVYTDPTEDGYLTPTGTGGPNTINYATGDIHIPAQAGNTVTVSFNYYPDLPVMGLEDFIDSAAQFPRTLGFDTKYSYNILTNSPYNIYDVSFYKNPPTGTYPGYIEKTIPTPTSWNGQNYQQFWTTNFQGALWTTNGITVPFTKTNIGMQYAPKTSITFVSITATTITVNIAGNPLVIGDFVFFNEWTSLTPANANNLNFQTGYVTNVVGTIVTITLPFATLPIDTYSPGIIQYLTNRSDPTKDCLRWYDGDPTNGNATNPVINGHLGWVNFAPPLIFSTGNNLSIDDLPVGIYYLVGARIVIPFKDRMLFFGPVIQTSVPNSQVYLQDTVIYGQNGTPYYTASFTGPVNSATTIFNPILTPLNQSAAPNAYFEDLTGFGGNISEGSSNPITTVGPNEDVLIVGFSNKETRFVYTGDDIIPFNFFTINSEFGSASTFSVVTLDRGVLKIGDRGIILSSQVASQRIDLEIPDQVFQISLINNGAQRVTAQRDFINEWNYFTYPVATNSYIFPTQTLQYNYREETWGIFNEAFTTYGQFRRTTGYTWATIGSKYPTWSVWNDPWNAGASNLEQPEVIAGNQQGFVLFREEGTTEQQSLYIKSFSGNILTVPDHCLNDGDYIIINGCLGTISAQVNGKIFQVIAISGSPNTFMLSPGITSGTYFGGGYIIRMYIPQIQTKQFPVSWGMARKTRLGPQQYLLTRTTLGQIELQIFLSQDAVNAYNAGPIVPEDNSSNDSLVYSDVLYTCPESANLGLTFSNSNFQMLVDPNTGASSQAQIWHRMNTSLLGDTVQIGFTLSDEQMRSLIPSFTSSAITGATQAYPCVLNCTASFSPGSLVQINEVNGMTQLNGNNYEVISSDGTHVTINVDSTLFNAYIDNGIVSALILPNQFAEIELHSFILDVSPSQVLA